LGCGNRALGRSTAGVELDTPYLATNRRQYPLHRWSGWWWNPARAGPERSPGRSAYPMLIGPSGPLAVAPGGEVPGRCGPPYSTVVADLLPGAGGLPVDLPYLSLQPAADFRFVNVALWTSAMAFQTA
jgi:hypothetical protein